MKGMTYTTDRYCNNVTLDSPRSFASLYHLRTTGANYVAFVVTEFLNHSSDNEIFPIYEEPFPEDSYYVYRTATIESLTEAINYAHAIGFKVMLKPHIDLIMDGSNAWRGGISGKGDEFYASYTKMIVKYSKLAEELGVEMVSVNCELVNLSGQSDYWRAVIKSMRDVYSGLLTDSANWGGEEMGKQWWDVVDYIGVDAYYGQGLRQGTETAEEMAQK